MSAIEVPMMPFGICAVDPDGLDALAEQVGMPPVRTPFTVTDADVARAIVAELAQGLITGTSGKSERQLSAAVVAEALRNAADTLEVATADKTTQGRIAFAERGLDALCSAYAKAFDGDDEPLRWALEGRADRLRRAHQTRKKSERVVVEARCFECGNTPGDPRSPNPCRLPGMLHRWVEKTP